MEEEAYHRVSITQRTLIVAGASAADMLVNFPLWICAKCVSAGIPLPSLRNLYKGSGSLYFAMGPLTIVEDRTTAVALDTIGDRLSVDLRHAASACISGGIAALTVGCQIEGIITRSHATGETVLQTAVSTHARGGFASIFVPYGAMMIAAREVCESWVRELAEAVRWLCASGGRSLMPDASSSSLAGLELCSTATAIRKEALTQPLSKRSRQMCSQLV